MGFFLEKSTDVLLPTSCAGVEEELGPRPGIKRRRLLIRGTFTGFKRTSTLKLQSLPEAELACFLSVFLPEKPNGPILKAGSLLTRAAFLRLHGSHQKGSQLELKRELPPFLCYVSVWETLAEKL